MFLGKIQEQLSLVLFKGCDGISLTSDQITTYETSITFGEFVDHFSAESNSDEIPETTKIQRDISKSRTDSIYKYLKERDDTFFPGIILVASSLSELKEVSIKSARTIYTGSIAETSQRCVLDGQGRHSAISKYLDELLEKGEMAKYNGFRSNTLSVKLIITNSDIYDARTTLRQAFSDLHSNLKKPVSSLNLYFNSNSSFSRLLDRTVEKIAIEKEGDFSNAVARNGIIRHGKIWKYTDVSSLLQKSLGLSKSRLAALLETEEDIDTYSSKIAGVLARVIAQLPNIAPTNTEHESALFTKSLFASGLGFAIRSAIESNQISLFAEMRSLPLNDKTDPIWRENGIMAANAAGNLGIVRACDKRIGLYLCEHCGIDPTPLLVESKSLNEDLT